MFAPFPFHIFIVVFFRFIFFCVFFCSPQHHLSYTAAPYMNVRVTVFILLMIWHHMPFVLSFRFNSILHFKYHLYGFLRMWLPIHIVYNIHMYSHLSTFGSYSCSYFSISKYHICTRTVAIYTWRFTPNRMNFSRRFFPYFIWFYYQFNMKFLFASVSCFFFDFPYKISLFSVFFWSFYSFAQFLRTRLSKEKERNTQSRTVFFLKSNVSALI